MGAFDFGPRPGYYHKGMTAWTDRRLAAALTAFKRELVYNGSLRKLRPWLPVFGDAMQQAVMDVQRARGRPATGTIDPDTAREIFRKRVETLELQYGWPHGTLGKKLWHESHYDPVAIGGADAGDRGISQISMKRFGGYHDVSLSQAYDPVFAIQWAARFLAGKKLEIVKRLGRDAGKFDVLKGARASYNVGVHYATEWLKAGCPAGDPAAAKGSTRWWFARATTYLGAIDRANF